MHNWPFLIVARGIELNRCCYKMHVQGSRPFNLGSVSHNVQLWMKDLFAALVTVLQKRGKPCPSDLFLSCMLTSCRHLSEEGIAELKGSAEKVTASDVIRIALNVSCSSDLSFLQSWQWDPCQWWNCQVLSSSQTFVVRNLKFYLCHKEWVNE